MTSGIFADLLDFYRYRYPGYPVKAVFRHRIKHNIKHRMNHTFRNTFQIQIYATPQNVFYL